MMTINEANIALSQYNTQQSSKVAPFTEEEQENQADVSAENTNQPNNLYCK